jgi:hypothetical protein
MGIEKKIPNSSNEFFHKIFMFLQKIANSVEDAWFLEDKIGKMKT